MGKANVKTVAAANQSLKATTPWACQHSAEGSSIDAYLESTGEWTTIARIPASADINPKEIAEQIVRAVNSYEKNHSMMSEMVEALKLCLECEGITWEAEHDADIMIDRFEALQKQA